VIDYKTQTFEDLIRDYDTVSDTVAGETYTRSFKVLKRCAIYFYRYDCYRSIRLALVDDVPSMLSSMTRLASCWTMQSKAGTFKISTEVKC